MLRFGAFLLVFLSHAFQNVPVINRVGGFGVDLFFALSAYLITTLLLKERAATGRIAAGKFYVRRGLRIWPLYFFFLLLVVPVAHFAIHDHLNRYYLMAFLVASGNWACVAWGFPASIAAPLWSVSIEEQFYAAWPFVMRRFAHRLPRIAIALLAFSTVARIMLVSSAASHTAVWCNTFTRLDPIAAGVILASYLDGRMPQVRATARAILIACGAGVVSLAGVFGDSSGPRCLWSYPLVAAGCSAILAGILGWDARWPNPLTYLGKISYGLYVFHVLALTLFHAAVLALPATIAISAFSYRFLETPFLRLKERFSVVRSRPA